MLIVTEITYIWGGMATKAGNVNLSVYSKLSMEVMPDSNFGVNGFLIEKYFNLPVYSIDASTRFRSFFIDGESNLYLSSTGNQTGNTYNYQYLKKNKSDGQNLGFARVGFGYFGSYLQSAILQDNDKILFFGYSNLVNIRDSRPMIARIMANSTTTILNAENIEKEQIKIYPNPMDDYLYIHLKSPTKNDKIKIYDFNGRIIVDQRLEKNETIINVRNLNKGIYNLKIGDKYSQKILKK